MSTNRQELLNAITSLLKFTPDRKPIDCWIEIGHKPDGNIDKRLRVTDNADGSPLRVEFIDYES